MQASTVDNERQHVADLDDDTWKRAAQRALHPTARPVDADVLAAIAAGLAAVTVPWSLALARSRPSVASTGCSPLMRTRRG